MTLVSGHGGIGRRAGFRFQWETVQVQVLLAADMRNAERIQHSFFCENTIAKDCPGMQNRSMMNMNTWPDVKVYMASAGCLEDEEVFRGWLEHVPAMRREKALRPKNPEVRKLSLAAGALLTCSLADYVRGVRQIQGETDLPGDDLRQIEIAENEHGKPYLPGYPKIHFSLSHSGDRVMCAVSQTKVGCDVEETGDTEADIRRIGYIARCLTESERKLALADPADFYRIWTLKESFVKLTGQGLLIPLSSFEITLDPTTVRQEYISADIELKEYGQIDGYQYSCMALQGHMADEMICVDLREALIKIQTGGGEV